MDRASRFGDIIPKAGSRRKAAGGDLETKPPAAEEKSHCACKFAL
jgi:hypothetical protein